MTGMTHAWTIAEREYARQLARRGRLHAYERLRAGATALVVVDMVPFFAQQNPYCRGAITPINGLAQALREAGGLVAWVLPSEAEPFPDLAREFHGAEAAEIYRTSGGTGALADRLCRELDYRSGDVIVEKTGASALFPGRCPLPEVLAVAGVETVIITGTVTNVCCESTARDARALGLRVIMAADANAARTDAEHNATLHTIYRSFGDVRPATEILEMIAASD